MAELKQSRWVKIHEPGQSNFVEDENVMDIMIGTGRCQAEATYTVRNFKKAAYWLTEYLKAAEALQIVSDEIIASIPAAAESANREDDEVNTSGEGWNCGIVKMGDGSFNVQLTWNVTEEVTKKQKAPKAKKPAKKRGRKKKGETADAPNS